MKQASVLATTALCAVLIISCNSGDKNSSETISVHQADSLRKVVERGQYLATYVAVCVDCHSKRDLNKFSLPTVPGTEYSGGITFDQGVGIPGELTPPNITPFTLKDWTDDEIIRALTKGINKKGDTLFPIMPYHSYSQMAKEDIHSIVAYLRTLKPIEGGTPPRKLVIPAAMFGPLPANNINTNPPVPDPADKVKYGQYLVRTAACSDCHTPMGPQGPDFSRAFAGGTTFKTPGFTVTIPNITPDSATGIGMWNEEAFVQKFKTNASDAVINNNPGKFNSFMPWAWYGKMKEEDLRAVYAYLRTVPAQKNKVEKWPAK